MTGSSPTSGNTYRFLCGKKKLHEWLITSFAFEQNESELNKNELFTTEGKTLTPIAVTKWSCHKINKIRKKLNHNDNTYVSGNSKTNSSPRFSSSNINFGFIENFQKCEKLVNSCQCLSIKPLTTWTQPHWLSCQTIGSRCSVHALPNMEKNVHDFWTLKRAN